MCMCVCVCVYKMHIFEFTTITTPKIISNAYIPVLWASRGFSALGQCSNGRGWNNAPLLHCTSALANPKMHT